MSKRGTSAEFMERANAAVKAATNDLLAKGIRPVYYDRDAGRTVGGGIDIDIEDRAVRDVLSDLLPYERLELRLRVVGFGKEEGGPRLVGDAVRAIASGLLLAKTAMPYEEAKFRQAINEQMARVRPHAVLIEVGHLMIDAELARENDVFRDRKVISDALFAQRVEAIRNALQA